jgi:hypothetical protein
LVWMGYSISKLRAIRSESIGAEVRGEFKPEHDALMEGLCLGPVLASRARGILRKYIEDIDLAISEVARVLTPEGRAVFVVGENTIRGTYVPTGQLITRIAVRAGLRLKDERLRDLPSNRRYLPPPGAGTTALDTRMRREVILTFGLAPEG